MTVSRLITEALDEQRWELHNVFMARAAELDRDGCESIARIWRDVANLTMAGAQAFGIDPLTEQQERIAKMLEDRADTAWGDAGSELQNAARAVREMNNVGAE